MKLRVYILCFCVFFTCTLGLVSLVAVELGSAIELLEVGWSWFWPRGLPLILVVVRQAKRSWVYLVECSWFQDFSFLEVVGGGVVVKLL